jgi:hypothetical protein
MPLGMVCTQLKGSPHTTLGTAFLNIKAGAFNSSLFYLPTTFFFILFAFLVFCKYVCGYKKVSGKPLKIRYYENCI